MAKKGLLPTAPNCVMFVKKWENKMSQDRTDPRLLKVRTEVFHSECPDCKNYYEFTKSDIPCPICGVITKTLSRETQELFMEEMKVEVVVRDGKDKPYRYMSKAQYERSRKDKSNTK